MFCQNDQTVLTTEFAAKGQDEIFKVQLIHIGLPIHRVSWCKFLGVGMEIPVHVAPCWTSRSPLESTGYAFVSKPYVGLAEKIIFHDPLRLPQGIEDSLPL
jgi:hypothetical protein